MKTIEQILEGVTAGGQWQIDADEPLIIWGPKGPGYGAVAKVSNYTLTGFEGDQVKTAAYAARAARNFPALVKALQNLHYAVNSASLNHPDLNVRLGAINAAHRAAIESQAVLAEALKD